MAIQRWTKTVTPVAGLNNEVSYTFPAIGQGFNALVSASIPGSDAVNTWTVLVAGAEVGASSGSQSFGPIFLGPGDVLSITGAPLFAAGPAVAVGAIGFSGEIPPSSIAPASNVALTTISPVSETYAGPSTSQVPVTVGATGILILSSSRVLSVVGVNGATNYDVFPYSPGVGLGQLGLYFAPVNGLWENSSTPGGVVITLATAGTIQVFNVQGSLGWPDPLDAVYTITVPNPAPGSDWSYILPAPARLQSAVALLETSATAVARLPRLILGVGGSAGQVLMVPVSVTASQTPVLTGFPEAALAEGGVAPFLYGTFPFPNVLLPAGDTIEVATQNLEPADQWSAITLTFTPI